MTVRPKGIVYIVYTTFISIIFLGLLCGDIFGLIYAFRTKSMMKVLIMIASTVVVSAWNVIQIKNTIHYKIVIRENEIFITANRELFLERHKDICFTYDKIKAIQYKKMLRPDLKERGMFYFSAIYIYREETFSKERGKDEYILTMWFSKKQVKKIMEQIVLNAEKQNGYPVEVFSDDIK